MLSIKEQQVYSLCLIEASKSKLLYQHGCIATVGGKIIERGINNHNNRNKLCVENICSCHAEIDVLYKIYYRFHKRGKGSKIDRIFRKMTLYITRAKNDGSYNSAPCIDCLNTIKKLDIKKIIFYQDERITVINPKIYFNDHMSHCQKYINSIIG